MKKVALITGSGRGIGAATAALLASQGYSICINYHNNKEAANQVLHRITSTGSNAVAVQADVSLENDVKRLFETIDQQLGLITHLVNNAGILLPQTTVEYMTADRINQLLTTNVTSYFLCCREAVKRMGTHHGGNGGAIANVSSGVSRLGSPGEYIDYAVTKGAIDTLTIGLSKEYFPILK